MSIVEFVDILARELLEKAKELIIPFTSIAGTESREIELQNSPLSQVAPVVEHTRKFLQGGLQLRCMWCGHMNLIDWKTTLKYFEYNKGFC